MAVPPTVTLPPNESMPDRGFYFPHRFSFLTLFFTPMFTLVAPHGDQKGRRLFVEVTPPRSWNLHPSHAQDMLDFTTKKVPLLVKKPRPPIESVATEVEEGAEDSVFDPVRGGESGVGRDRELSFAGRG